MTTGLILCLETLRNSLHIFQDNEPFYLPIKDRDAQLQFFAGDADNCSTLTLTAKNITKKEYAELDSNKYRILAELELLLQTNFTEHTNNDPCSISFHWDTNHLGGTIEITLTITDYFS